MRAIAYNGVTFSTYGLVAGVVRGLPGEDRSPNWLARTGTTPLSSGVGRGARPINVFFYLDPSLSITETGNTSRDRVAESRMFQLLGALDPNDDTPRPLTVEIDLDTDSNGTIDSTVTTTVNAVIGPYSWRDDDGKMLDVTFYAASPVWRKTSASSLGAQSISSSGSSFTITNNGYARAYPTFTIAYTVQRATQTDDVGWKYRKTATFTNNETRTAPRVTRYVDLGDTAALVSGGKALSSGNDLRVRVNGKELPRTLQNWNTKRTIMAVVVTIPAKSSITVEIVYGNPSAGTPETLNTLGGARTRPDLFTALDCYSSNGTATSGAASTLTDTGKAWKVDRFKGGFIQITGGTGVGQRRRIASNTATAITVTRAWTTNPSATSTYVIWMGGIYADGGAASSATTTTITDSSQSWGPNSLIGGTCYTALVGDRTIVSNTATSVTVSPAFSGTPGASSTYTIERYGYEKYAVDKTVKRDSDDVWMGCWYQDARYTRPGTVQTGADGIADAWQPFLMLRNSDDYGQKSTTPSDVGGGDLDYFNGLDVNRRVGSDRRLGEEGAADGIIRTSPHGYDAVYVDYQVKNPNGQCTATLRSRADGGLDWQSVFDYSTAQASLTNISPAWYDLTGNEQIPLHLYMGLLPVANSDGDNVAIPSTASANDTSTFRNWQRLELFANLSNWSPGVLSAEENIYDLSATIKLAALAASPPYDQIVIGGAGHYLHLTSTQSLVVTTDPDATTPILALYDGGVFVKEVSYAAIVYRVITDQSGNAVNTVSQEFLPLKPGNTTVTVTEAAIGTITVAASWYEGYYG